MQEISYYKSVVAKMGQARADSFIRFYVTPGVNHGGEGVLSHGAAVPAKSICWARSIRGPTGPGAGNAHPGDAGEGRAVQGHRVAADVPLSAHPRYDGEGDPKAASSFTCAPQ